MSENESQTLREVVLFGQFQAGKPRTNFRYFRFDKGLGIQWHLISKRSSCWRTLAPVCVAGARNFARCRCQDSPFGLKVCLVVCLYRTLQRYLALPSAVSHQPRWPLSTIRWLEGRSAQKMSYLQQVRGTNVWHGNHEHHSHALGVCVVTCCFMLLLPVQVLWWVCWGSF